MSLPLNLKHVPNAQSMPIYANLCLVIPKTLIDLKRHNSFTKQLFHIDILYPFPRFSNDRLLAEKTPGFFEKVGNMFLKSEKRFGKP